MGSDGKSTGTAVDGSTGRGVTWVSELRDRQTQFLTHLQRSWGSLVFKAGLAYKLGTAVSQVVLSLNLLSGTMRQTTDRNFMYQPSNAREGVP